MIRRIVLVVVFASALVAMPFAAFAATLAITPVTTTVNAGSDFTVNVVVSSPGEAINAAMGDLSFPSNKLRIIGVSKSDSIMTLWVQDPSFSNGAPEGMVNFAGVIFNPGWTGSNGTVITVAFQAIVPGNASITFASGTVLANDGNGTDVLTALGSANVIIAPAAPNAPSSAATSTSLPLATPGGGIATSTSQSGFSMGSLEYFLIVSFALLFVVALLLFLIILYLWIHRSAKKGLGVRDRKQLYEDLKHVAKDIEHLEKDLADPGE
jgi:hypothetical protein